MVSVLKEDPHPEDLVNFLQPAKLFELDYGSGEHNMFAMIENAVEKVEPLNMPIKIGNISTTLLVDSGSACSNLNRSFASQVVQVIPRAFWIREKTSPQLRTFSNEPVQVEGKIQCQITSNSWTCDTATFTVVADGLKSLIGRKFFDQLGLAVTQSTSQNVIVSITFLLQNSKNKSLKLFLTRHRASVDQKTMWQNLSFAKTFNLDIKKVDVFPLTYKKI